MDLWTQETLVDLARMSEREFDAAYRGQFSKEAIHIQRRRLIQSGVAVLTSGAGVSPPPPVVELPALPPEPDPERMWEAYAEMQKLRRAHDQARAQRYLKVGIETDRPVGVVFMSDFHLGGDGVDHQRLREDVELIRTCARLRVVVGGDGIDNFIIPALAHAHRETAIFPPEMQMVLFRDVIQKLLPQLLCVGTGNHDLWTRKMAGIDASLSALAGLPVLHTKEDTYLDLSVGGQTYTVWRKHRPPSGSSKNNPTGGIQSFWRHSERPFDVGVTEHHHTPHMATFTGHGQIRWALTTGSYKTDDSHAREYGHVDSRVGTPVMVFYPHRRAMVGFMSIVDAIEFLEIA